ncbi:ParA family protein (plasmid) [Aeromonas media]|uniref:ParA family protein n=6 Tax=Aeromonas TaxID=642 RepID=A0A7D5YS54_AERCA|nr:ParA family protein [Aeromonas caviae]QLI60536.1 ParA family protein [Aeromonas caviae]QYK83471.1 ParA family protein [Aeromonas media]
MNELKPVMKQLAGRILAITNEKGGVGKTTYCHHICHALLDAGLTVAAVDFDPQRNFTNVMTDHARIDTTGYLCSSHLFSDVLPELPLYEARPGFYLLAADPELADIETIPFESGVVAYPGYHLGELVKAHNIDVVVIDTPPVAGNRQLAGVLAATNVLLPMELTQFSIDGIGSVFERLEGLCRAFEYPLPSFTLLPNRINARAAKTAAYLDAIVNTYPSVALPALVQRQPIADAADSATPVWKLRDGNARVAATNLKQQLTSMVKEILA